MGRRQEKPRIVIKRRLRPIAMMNIEINNGYAFETMFGTRVQGSDGNIVEEAETHRP